MGVLKGLSQGCLRISTICVKSTMTPQMKLIYVIDMIYLDKRIPKLTNPRKDYVPQVKHQRFLALSTESFEVGVHVLTFFFLTKMTSKIMTMRFL